MRQKWRRVGDIANSRKRRRRPAKVLPIKCYCYWWVLWTGIKSSGQEAPATQPSEKTQPKDKWTEANGSRGVVINSFVLAGIGSSGRKRSWSWGCRWVVGRVYSDPGYIIYSELCSLRRSGHSNVNRGWWELGVAWLLCSFNSQSEFARRADGRTMRPRTKWPRLVCVRTIV